MEGNLNSPPPRTSSGIEESNSTEPSVAAPRLDSSPPLRPKNSKPKRRAAPQHPSDHDRNNSKPNSEETVESPHLWTALLRGTPSWLVSTVLHLILCLILAWLTFPPQETEELDSLAVSEVESEVSEEMTDVNVEVASAAELKTDQSASSDLSSLLTNASSDPLGEISLSDISLDTGGSELSEIVKGTGSEDGPKTPAKFFGTQAKGNRLVFVVDNSNSMGKGKFETALVELSKAIKTLGPKQRFYIIFYSDTAYPLFYPRVMREMIPATPANVRRVGVWLSTVQMCLQTRGEDAMRIAMMLRPDVIYLLGDGRFTDKTTEILLKNPVPGVVIHTLGMQLSKNEATEFAAIAKSHRGKYRDVGVTPEGRAMLEAMGPRPKNKSPNGYWGIALGKKKK